MRKIFFQSVTGILGKRNVKAVHEQVNKFYHINTNEIPGELSRENMISSHVKITCYLHM